MDDQINRRSMYGMRTIPLTGKVMTYVEQKIMIAVIAIVFYGMFQLLTSS